MRGRKEGMQSEAAIQVECRLALSAAGCLIWRQNTGVLPDKTGRLIRFGLCVGSSDLIGISMDGLFLAVEVKSATGKPSAAQLAFIRAVRGRGGRAGLARSAAEAVALATLPLDELPPV